jgi:predicted ATPase/DNA-binding CsgD family transcriptional regulator
VHNLPVELNSFVGRERELEELRDCLGRTRLLTLTGIGGSGKTRLALRLAATVADEYPDGVWLVGLGPVLDENLLPQAVASVLEAHERSGEALGATLGRHLRNKRMLLVLDSCEHLIDPCARFVEMLLAGCAQMTVLATSQEVLRVPGELVWRVPSLSLPPPDSDQRAESLMVSEAVRLFVERAALVQPGFSLKEQRGPAIAKICHRLDGLPLAIELAAAQIRLMPPEELETRLQDRFRLLTGGSRTAVARHQTLRATVDWSYSRLDLAEQALFRRLSVFPGGFDLAAVEVVCEGSPIPTDVLGCLRRLIDRSLVGVLRDGACPPARYHLLETLRHYGEERLAESGEVSVRRRHAEYYWALAKKACDDLIRTSPSGALAVLEAEQGNLRAALTWALANDRDLLRQLGAALMLFWHLKGSPTEGNEWLAAAADSSTPSPTVSFGLTLAGWVVYWQGDYERSRSLAERGLALARDVGALSEMATAVNLVGVLSHVADENLEGARRCFTEAYEIRSKLNDRWGIASSLNNLALVEYSSEVYEVAESLAQQALTQIEALGYKLARGNVLDTLARIVLDRGRPADAQRYHCESLAVAQALGSKVDTADALDGLARVAVAVGDSERALVIAGAARALHDRIGYATPRPWRRRLEASMESARAALGREAASLAWDRGMKLREQEAVALALTIQRQSPENQNHAPDGALTMRECEIAGLIATGLGNKQVASLLKISERTVDAHVEHIRNKLEVHSRAQIAAWASRNGLVPTADAGSPVYPNVRSLPTG